MQKELLVLEKKEKLTLGISWTIFLYNKNVSFLPFSL